jgi:hypothetical protein
LLYRSTGHATPEAEVISSCLLDPELPNRFKELEKAAAAINSTYRGRFGERHEQRLTEYRAAIQSIKDQSEYRALEPTEADSALAPLTRRASETFDLPEYSAADRTSGGTLATLEDDLELLPSLHAGALSRLAELRESKEETEDAVEVIRLGDFLPKTQPLTDFSDTEIDEALEKLKQKLYALRELKRRVLWD